MPSTYYRTATATAWMTQADSSTTASPYLQGLTKYRCSNCQGVYIRLMSGKKLYLSCVCEEKEKLRRAKHIEQMRALQRSLDVANTPATTAREYIEVQREHYYAMSMAQAQSAQQIANDIDNDIIRRIQEITR